MNGDIQHLPLKIVIASEGDMKRPLPARGKPKSFSRHYPDMRDAILGQLTELEQFFESAFTTSNLPAVGRLILRDDAIAKSHRPELLFAKSKCNVIGGQAFGQLLIRVRPDTIRQFKKVVSTTTDDKLKSDIGKIQTILPYTPDDVLGHCTKGDFNTALRQVRAERVKLRLFSHHHPDTDNELERAFLALAEESGIPTPTKLDYAPGLRLYSIDIRNSQTPVTNLASFLGTQSITTFHHFNVSPQVTSVGTVPDDDFPPPDPGEEYPVVGILDTGTDPHNSLIQAWVVTRDESDVPSVDQDNSHGTMVSSITINGRTLNGDRDGFPKPRTKVLDVVAFPKGGTGELELLDTMRRAFSTYTHVKIWNLSINSTDRTCETESFSHFAMALDHLQDEFGVMVVNSAGNFVDRPAHNWPRPDLNNRDRIFPPADSLRAITVGSQAHLTSANACAKVGEPSPFTRRGPGAAFVPKPDVSHFGGNATATLNSRQIGILSMGTNRQLVESIGTSLAAPLVASTAAHVAHNLDQAPSRHLLKALLVHTAVTHSTKELKPEDLQYIGFGRPPEPDQILRCRPWEATMIFDLDIKYSTRRFQKLNFPVPPCLVIKDKVHADITITLVYDPPVNPADGAAYSQVNIDPSLGTCDIDDGSITAYKRRIVPYPEDYEDLFEKNQIQHGYKWSPVKVYRCRMARIQSPDAWRIGLSMQTRSQSVDVPAQKAVLVATIADPEAKRPVYDEVMALLNQFGWITQNLQIRTPGRVRVR